MFKESPNKEERNENRRIIYTEALARLALNAKDLGLYRQRWNHWKTGKARIPLTAFMQLVEWENKMAAVSRDLTESLNNAAPVLTKTEKSKLAELLTIRKLKLKNALEALELKIIQDEARAGQAPQDTQAVQDTQGTAETTSPAADGEPGNENNAE